ncbi:MAG: monofunctional biosynthetic peptidoglycan transglycosylase [Flavobacteriaceae bacterium]|nr:monofunctional biosynthetic peptidoglycan transglycosylase [Flavobacteriaceae bacterium]
MFRKLLRIIKKIIIWFFIISIGLVVLFKWVPVPFTYTMISRSVGMMVDGKEVVWQRDWVSLEKISPNLPQAVVASEDNLFTTHNGFSMNAIKKAMEANKKGKKLRGGSTISQQTAKNVFLWQGRNWVRKGFEVYFTFLIELIWGKERIMEVYLNSIEMGNGIYGAEAASRYWYHKSAKNLSTQEAAGIAAILPNPRKFKASNSSSYINRRKASIQSLMRKISKVDYDAKKKRKEK